ncbi:MAG: 7-carboxy-7-deazaguanine synthase, partial [Deltaproteobacteria bacterium]|nr:7-carboxy-7-deazaguanine synthase [Deltaproteobacteria bacterium]
VNEIMAQVTACGPRLVLLTGGEPLLQPHTPALADLLLRAGFEVLVETNGTMDISVLPPGVIRIVDVKCPGSGEAGGFLRSNLDYLTPTDEIKFVISSQEDFDYAVNMVQRDGLDSRAVILLSPVFGVMPPASLAASILASGLQIRLQLQLHKYIWSPESRGV